MNPHAAGTVYVGIMEHDSGSSGEERTGCASGTAIVDGLGLQKNMDMII